MIFSLLSQVASGDGTNNVLYLVIVALLTGVGAVLKVAHSEIVRGRDRAEKQVDDTLPSLKSNTDAINSMVVSQRDFKGFLGDLIATMSRVATSVSPLTDDHKKMLERLDSIDKRLDVMERSSDDVRYGRYADEDRAQRRTRSDP